MSRSRSDLQGLLDKILSSGKDIIRDVQNNSGDLTAKGKDLALRGEDILVDKLGIKDTEAGRDALRKGVGTGAAAGALALLLSSRSGRKVAGLGGLAGLGLLAYKAYQMDGADKTIDQDECVGELSGGEDIARSELLLKAMVSAAKADGIVSDAEMTLIRSHDPDALPVIEAFLAEPADPELIAAEVDCDQAALEVYAVSCRVADGINIIERDYLDRLAMALHLDPELAARIETDIRTG